MQDESLSEEESVINLQEFDFAQHSVAPPGPGLPESLLWIAGMMVVQGIAFFVVLNVLILAGFTGELDVQNLKQADLKAIQKEQMPLIIFWVQGITAVIVFFAVVLRLGGKKALIRLPVKRLNVGHAGQLGLLVFIFFAVIAFTGQWNSLVLTFWNDTVLVYFPQLKSMEEQSSIELLKKMISVTPLWALLLVFAATPAFSEELLFRGLIGRGLTARWGVVAGVIITSVLFAAVHFSPPHALALLPLAVVLHLAHLATRSIWAPMLIHFFFNAITCVVGKISMEKDPHAFDNVDSPQFSLFLFFASGFCLVALCWLLWSRRYRFTTANGTELPEGYFAADVPEEQMKIEGTFGTPQTAPIVASIFGLLLLTVSIIVTGLNQQP